jgi:hypothetical protein
MLPLPGIELTGKSRFSQTFPIVFSSLLNKTLLSAIRVVAAVAWLLPMVPAYSVLSPLREFAAPVVEVLYFRYFIAVCAVILFALAWVYNPKSLPIEGLANAMGPACNHIAISGAKCERYAR